MNEPIHIISLGAGVQSSTMALMAAAGEITPMPKCAIFADTQAESASVYTWLDTVLTWLNRRIREGKRDTGSRRFSTLIANLDRFDEELSMAKAEKRNVRPAMTPKERVIEQARPTVGEQTQAEVNARNAQDVALAALRAMKKELFGTEL